MPVGDPPQPVPVPVGPGPKLVGKIPGREELRDRTRVGKVDDAEGDGMGVVELVEFVLPAPEPENCAAKHWVRRGTSVHPEEASPEGVRERT